MQNKSTWAQNLPIAGVKPRLAGKKSDTYFH